MLYFHHPSSLEHDPSLLLLDHPDTPERISAIEAALSQVGWLGCDVRDAPAATETELELVHTRLANPNHPRAVRRRGRSARLGHVRRRGLVPGRAARRRRRVRTGAGADAR